MYGKRNRRGAAMLEAAIVLPFFLLLILGILEFGRAVMLHQITTNACREAARHAITPGAVQANVTNICEDYLESANISETGRSIGILDSSGTAASLSSIQPHEEVTVFIDIPFDENSWGLLTWLIGKSLRSEVTMRRE